MDDSGEDYLYPESFFISVQLPKKAQEALSMGIWDVFGSWCLECAVNFDFISFYGRQIQAGINPAAT